MNKLSQKIGIGVLGSLVATSVATTAFVVRSERHILEEDLQHAGRTLASTIAAFCVETLLVQSDYPYLQTYISQSARDSQHVEFIRVWERRGVERRLVAEYPPKGASETSRGEGRTFRSPIVVEAEGVPSEVVGEVEVALSGERLERLIATSTWQLATGGTLTFSILALVIGVLLKKSVLDPVERLDEDVRRIAAGDLDSPIASRTSDELGRLAATLDSMRASLKDSYAQIERQVEELKELDRMKDEFLANTSHELKTPLNGILGLADAMSCGRYGEVPAELRVPLEHVTRCADRLWKMTESILQFSQLAHVSSRAPSPREKGLLARHLEDALVDLKIAAESKGLKLRLSIDPRLEVTYRRSELEDIVRILVDNAVKYTERGRIEVLAAAWPQGSAAPGFQVGVRDTGVGIPEEAREKIFEPFVQGFHHETRAHGGVGLGLAIARGLAEKLGGELVVESEAGRGSTFTVLVPEVDVESPRALYRPWPPAVAPAAACCAGREPEETGAGEGEAAAVEELRSPPAQQTSRDGRRDHVLVVDDEPTNLEVLERALQDEYQVSLARNAAECYAVLRRQPVDLLLLDIMMPGESGFHVLNRMASEGLLEKTSVVVLSAKTSAESVVKGLELGASDYLGKPFRRQELLCRIRTQLAIRHQRKQLENEVREKTLALEIAQQASYVKDQFLANMSHEIRTPITGLIGFLSLAIAEQAEGGDVEVVAEYLAEAQRSTEALLKVVDDVLDLEKIESQQVSLDLSQVRPLALLEAVAARWRETAERKELTLELELEEGLELPVRTDAGKLQQILDHVLDNAFKFTEKGGVHVTARREEIDGEMPRLVIDVHDTGVGIPSGKLHEIFQPFVQGDMSATRRYGGSGLGLSVSRMLARRLGGEITVDSEPGRGSNFRIVLPAASDGSAPSSNAAALAAAAGGGSRDR